MRCFAARGVVWDVDHCRYPRGESSYQACRVSTQIRGFSLFELCFVFEGDVWTKQVSRPNSLNFV